METWSCKKNDFNIRDFYQTVRIDGPIETKPNPEWGSVIFLKSFLNKNIENYDFKKNVKLSPVSGHRECVEMRLAGVRLISVYPSPKCVIKTALACMDEVIFKNVQKNISLPPIIVVGDFNVDFSKNQNNEIFKYFIKYGLHS